MRPVLYLEKKRQACAPMVAWAPVLGLEAVTRALTRRYSGQPSASADLQRYLTKSIGCVDINDLTARQRSFVTDRNWPEPAAAVDPSRPDTRLKISCRSLELLDFDQSGK